MSLKLRERLLLKRPLPAGSGRSLWIHCASVGEFNTVKPLIRRLRERFSIVLTYFSPRAEDYLRRAEGVYDVLFPLPLDLPPLVRRFEESVKPAALLIMERELWFSLIRFTRCRKILLNAYAKKGVMERLLARHYSLIIARTERDQRAFVEQGARKVVVCGNLKLVREEDVIRPAEIPRRQGKIMIAGSTHEGEEELILRIFGKLRRKYPLRLIIAPRHISRAERVKELADSFGFSSVLRSRGGAEWDVLVLDTLGELRSFYLLGDVAFVGGTFTRVGGHNLLEPAFAGKPVIFGPHTHKVRDLESLVVEKGFGFRANSEEEFLSIADRLLSGGFSPGEDLRELSRRTEECYLKHILSELE